MNIFKQFLQWICPHKWDLSYEKYTDYEGGEHIDTRRKWTCSRCGKVSYGRRRNKRSK